MKTTEEIKELAEKRYGTDINSFGGQRDGFKEGYKQCQDQQLIPHPVIPFYLDSTKEKPKHKESCIVNNEKDTYELAFWDEDNNCFLGSQGYLNEEYKYWIYLHTNKGQ